MKLQLLSSLLAATATVATGVFASPALAFDFVPQQEGEIDVGLGCYDGCIELDPIFESIISLGDATTGSRSRLFVDNLDTKSTYNSGQTVFKQKDAGTNWGGFFFRPSEYNESTGYAEEKGQLEVGTFQFNFSQTLAEFNIDFFDTESWESTGITAINGVAVTPDWLAKGKDGNVQSRSLFNVDSVTIKFGFDKSSGTGDGVNFKMSGQPAPGAGVPEPTTIIGGLIASAGMAAARKRAKK
jgi:hypothetical protein